MLLLLYENKFSDFPVCRGCGPARRREAQSTKQVEAGNADSVEDIAKPDGEVGKAENTDRFANAVQMADAGVDVREHFKRAQFRFAPEVRPLEDAANTLGTQFFHKRFEIAGIIQHGHTENVGARFAALKCVGAEVDTFQSPALLRHGVQPALFFFKVPFPE